MKPLAVVPSYQSLPLTYEEFRITKCATIDKEEIVNNFFKPKLTPYAAERSKYNLM